MSELHLTPTPHWAQVTPAETPSLRSLTTLAVSVVVVAALYFGREVLIPITLAILLSFVLAPLAALLRRAIGRIPAIILSVLIAVTIFLALAGVIGMQLAELANDVPRYQTTIRQKVDTLRRFTTEPLSGVIGTVGREVQKAGKEDTEQAK
jgi:predicted PurR-regulated permease PerM